MQCAAAGNDRFSEANNSYRLSRHFLLTAGFIISILPTVLMA
jgi:hypothetical protein